MRKNNNIKDFSEENAPKLVVIAGVNGAGKSTLIKNNLVNHPNFTVINPDEKLKQYKQNNPNDGEMKAWRFVVESIDQCLNDKKDLLLETTLTGKKVINRMKTAKENGYDVGMKYVVLDCVDRHVERVASRVEKGGHHIPEEDIRRRYKRSMGNLKEASQHVDKLTVFDNTGKHHVRICEIENDKITYKNDDIKNKDITNFLYSFEDATVQAADDYPYAAVANHDIGR